MNSMWSEAIASVNTYVEKLQEQKTEGKVTVIMFDDADPYMVVRDKVSIPYFDKLDVKENLPRGMTPLYDAAGKAIANAIQDKAEKTVIVIMTDGHENSSKEFNQASIKASIKSVQDMGMEVIFLGANFDAKVYADAFGMDVTKFANSRGLNMTARMAQTAFKTANYAATGATMGYTEQEKTELE